MNIKILAKGYLCQLVIALLLILSIGLTACGGASDDEATAAKPRSRAVINSGDIVPAEEVRVAEYLQYYDQFLPEPENNAIGLDLRLGNSLIPAQGAMAWLQIGLQAKSVESEMVAPLNIAVVIDSSGSMDASDKMPYVKQSLEIFLEDFDPNDTISIVTYSDDAQLVLPAQQFGDGMWVKQAIDRIETGGGTNLHAGMMVGFQEVDKNYDIRRNNRVILLTDGIANRGVTDTDSIVADALTYNEKGIYLSTIGLGLDFNDRLLSELAHQGKGGYSFIDSAAEMERAFREHAVSQKQRIASDVKVTFKPASGVRLIGLTGLEGKPPSEGASIPLWPMSTGNSTVILAEMQIGSGSTGTRPLATIQLQYYDEFSKRTVGIEQSISAEMVSNLASYDPTWDLEVLRNVTIQNTAEGMREIDRLFDQGQYETAWRLGVKLEQQLSEVARLTDDEQMIEDAALMQKYQQTLANAVWETQDRAPKLGDTTTPSYSGERPYRGETPIPDVPEVEVR